MSFASEYRQIRTILRQRGYNCQVYEVPEATATIACPCTKNNRWGSYSSLWHTRHPDAPNCNRTGLLTSAGEEAHFALTTIRGIAMPHWTYTREQFIYNVVGPIDKFEWLGITQAEEEFNRWIGPKNFLFSIKSVLPYFVGGGGVRPLVTFYIMEPLNTHVPIP